MITCEVARRLHIDYKEATIKHHHKVGRPLRTDTTINDTHAFGIRKRLKNLHVLGEIVFNANRCLLRDQGISHGPIAGIQTLRTLTNPVITDTGTVLPGCAWGNNGATHCSRHCPSSGCKRTGSSAGTCAR